VRKKAEPQANAPIAETEVKALAPKKRRATRKKVE